MFYNFVRVALLLFLVSTALCVVPAGLTSLVLPAYRFTLASLVDGKTIVATLNGRYTDGDMMAIVYASDCSLLYTDGTEVHASTFS